MSKIECTTQAEADAAAAAGDIIVWRKGHLVLHDSSSADLYGSSSAYLHDSSIADLHDSSRASLHDSSSAVLYGSSSAVLYGSSSADLYDSSIAVLYGSSSADLYDSSIAVLYGSSSAEDGKTGAPLARARPRLVIGPLGSRGDTLGVSLPSDGSEPVVYAGCWSGRLSDFAARVESVYPTGRYGDEYCAAIAMIRGIAAIPQEAA